MHLVFVSSLVPVENPASGFDIANRTVLDGLRALGHRVSVIGYLQPGQRVAPGGDVHLLGELEVTNARVDTATKARWLASALWNRTTLSSAKVLRVGRARIEALLHALQPFDGLILNSVQLSAAFADIFQRYPNIYVAHNVEADSALQNAQAARGRMEKLLFRREARFLRHFERQLTQGARAIWTFAEEDRFGFGDRVAERAAVLPLVTRWDLPPIAGKTPPEQDLGLIGTWSWKPNRIGLDWFLAQVVPLLPHDVSIAIAGQMSEVPSVAHPGVRFAGRVPDANAFVRASAVVPLVSQGGTGVQLKTIETFELGVPSVATRASLRGIGILPANCAVAEDPAVFARLLIDRVGAVRNGATGVLSGEAFRQTQKTALLDAMQTGLSGLAHQAAQAAPSLQQGNAPFARVQRTAEIKKISFSVFQGGKSR